MILAGTGSRQLLRMSESDQKKIMDALKEFVSLISPDEILSGGAEGFDEALALCAHRMEIPYRLILPSPGYGEYYWGNRSVTNSSRIDRFNAMCHYAHDIEYVADHHGFGRSNFLRNINMIERADHVIAWAPKWDVDNQLPESSGTRHGITTCMKAHIPLSVLIPVTVIV